MGANALSPLRQHMRLRWVLLIGIGLVVASTVVETKRFPGILTPPSLTAFYLVIFALTLVAYVAMAISATRATALGAEVALGHALWWGSLVGVLWWIEIMEANVWRWPGLGLGLLYFAPEIAAYVLPGVAAALAARRTRRFRIGLLAGLWTGMVGGLLAFLGGTAILWLFNDAFLHDPQNVAEFLASHAQGLAPDLQTYVVGDLLAGLLVHLAFIGILLGALIGAVGAAVGMALVISLSAAPDRLTG
jgi:hypothetical protein